MCKQFFRNEANNHDTRLAWWGHEKSIAHKALLSRALRNLATIESRCPESRDKNWNKEQMYRNVETKPGLPGAQWLVDI